MADRNVPFSPLEQTKAVLDAVSPSFCLAKWLQSTLHLHRGLTHSCHHPKAHGISLHELGSEPEGLHNTPEKLLARQQMLDGIRPPECGYCWDVEDLGKGHWSDRVLKSKDPWALPHLGSVLADPRSKKLAPRYLEVSFSRACNFKCSYCAPAFSSSWSQEIRQSGPYTTRQSEHLPELLTDPFPDEDNPYTKAFWQWWPELKNSLHTFRITGGEPLLSAETFRLLEELEKDSAPLLSLSINSNLGVGTDRLDQFLEKVARLLRDGRIKNFHLYTSVEAWGPKAEYIRHGLKFDSFWHNLERTIVALPESPLTIMSAFNALSVSSYLTLLRGTLELRKRHFSPGRPCPLFIDLASLRHPAYQAANVLPEEFSPRMDEIVSFLEENGSARRKQAWGFYRFELNKAQRIREWMRILPKDISLQRANFYRFFFEHDRRRDTHFPSVFPEMGDFWNECERLALSQPEPGSQLPA